MLCGVFADSHHLFPQRNFLAKHHDVCLGMLYDCLPRMVSTIATNNAFLDIHLIDGSALRIIVDKRRPYANPQDGLDDMRFPCTVENCVRANGVNRHISKAHFRMLHNQLLNQDILALELTVNPLYLRSIAVNRNFTNTPPFYAS